MERKCIVILMKIINTYIANHRGERRIFLDYEFSTSINRLIKQIEGRKYSATLKKWHLPIDTDLEQLNKQFQDILKFEQPKEKVAKRDTKNFDKKNFELYIQHIKLRKLSKHTLEIYSLYFKEFLVDQNGKTIENLNYREIYHYIRQKISKNYYSEAQKKQLISAIKFYYEQVLGREKMYFKLGTNAPITIIPVRLTLQELTEILKKINAPADKLLITLVYYFNYSVEQISNLTLEQSKKLLHKANKTEYKIVKTLLKDHYLKYKPKNYLFEDKQKNRISEQKIEKKILQITSYYRLTIIYRKQIENALWQAEFSNGTKKNYQSALLNFLKYFNFRHPKLIKNEEIKQYLQQFAWKSEAYQNNLINALKFYYGRVLKRPTPPTVFVRPKRKRNLPEVLSLSEIKAIIEVTNNLKHKTLLSLIYSAGLRRSEAQNLTLNDIDSKRQIIRIRGAKGKKDRYVPLSANLLQLLRQYYKAYRPKYYLFEGENGGKYSFTSMSKVLKHAARRAGISRNVHLHMLRHSYATHLLEQGTDIRIIQEILGHNSIKTTERYTHIANTHLRSIKNPFDSFFNNEDNKSPP